ncbi:MAG: hypothetical protein H7829_13610 [Magnetococcus sp. THC-1_WYH]
MTEDISTAWVRAARAIGDADALLITAGAGMGVDSGLPDFRGNTGFWRHYPPMESLGLAFVDMANPERFRQDPTLAWGFYGHRLHLYRQTPPHDGYRQLLDMAHNKPRGFFVFTSNVDGHFQRSGFPMDRVAECHGSIHHLQCLHPCSRSIWSADATNIPVDQTTFRATGTLPQCPNCRRLARPNVLMFDDGQWIPDRTNTQTIQLKQWLSALDKADDRLTVVELGAGLGVPTVRRFSESVARHHGGNLVRINIRDHQVPGDLNAVSLPLGAAEAVLHIDEKLKNL